MNQAEDREDRIAGLVRAMAEADGRFAARLRSALAAEAEARPAGDGWSLAQIAWHVAALNRLFATLLDGSSPGLRPAPAGFEERSWAEIEQRLLGPAAAPESLSPPPAVTHEEAIEAFERAASSLRSAFAALTSDRAGLTLTHPLVGTVTAMQIADWARAHTIRHNQQMKRVLGR